MQLVQQGLLSMRAHRTRRSVDRQDLLIHQPARHLPRTMVTLKMIMIVKIIKKQKQNRNQIIRRKKLTKIDTTKY